MCVCVCVCTLCRYRAGAAYVVFGRADGDFAESYDLGSTAVIDGKRATSFLGLRAQNALGIGVGPAGDFNGDGIADLWVRIICWGGVPHLIVSARTSKTNK